MKTPSLITAALALLAAVEAHAEFDQANAAFAEKRYAAAASGYEAVIRRQGFSVPVLFNLANAFYCDGKLGRAILNYERAQLLAPRAADIDRNLSVVRRKAGLADQPAHWLSSDELSWLASMTLGFIAAGFLFRQVTKRAGLAWRGWIAVNACVLLAAMIALFLRFPQGDRAIVIAETAPAYIAPVTVTQPIFTLTEGQPVSIRKVNGDFLLVEDGDGRRGWVTPAAVERVTPM